MQHFDIVVVGSGPAGAAAACVAARSGLSVALIDRQSFPRTKLCGGGVTGRAVTEYRRIFQSEPPKMDKITRFEFHAHGTPTAQLRDMPPMYLTMRHSFDAAMHAHALHAGAVEITDQLLSIDAAGTNLTLRSGDQITFKVLIGADGVKSVVAKHLFGESYAAQNIGFALEIEAPAESAPRDAIRIDFGAAHWGYGWRFPKTGTTTIGVGGLQVENPNIKTALENYQQTLGLPETVKPKVKGHHLPFGHFRRVPGRGNLLLCGDAAGLVDPITGEGIAHALTSGAAAAEAAIAACQTDVPTTALQRYRPKLRKIHNALRIARALRVLIFARPFQNIAASTLSGSGTLRTSYLYLLAGNIEYPAFIWSVFKRIPNLTKRALNLHRTAKPEDQKK